MSGNHVPGRIPVLLPTPQKVTAGEGALDLRSARILLPAPVEPSLRLAADRLVRTAEHEGGYDWSVHAGSTAVRAYRDSSLPLVCCELREGASERPTGAYRLEVDSDGARVIAFEVVGLVYGLVTLGQLLRGSISAVPAVVVDDWPAIGRRALMLDQSRDRVATTETLRTVVEDMARLKLNELHLYCEHTFSYVDREVVWAGDDAITASEMLELDEFCRLRHIDLVPTMNSLGHMHKWLEHPEYADLAENHPYRHLPEMDRIALRGERRPIWGDVPFSLCAVDDRSKAFVDELMDELLPHFTSAYLNANLDEPFDLGLGRSREAVDRHGRAQVYLDYLLDQNRRVRARGLTMHFGADVTWSDPELLDGLPRDAVIMDWGYCRDFPFDEHARGFAAAGQPFTVLTGTNSWETIAGATDDMVAHHRLAAAAVVEHGGLGLMATDWGSYDHGSVQQHVVSYPGFAVVAAEGWHPGASSVGDVAEGLSRHVFDEPEPVLGPLLFDLGALADVVGLTVSDIGGVRATVRSPVFVALRGTLADVRDALGDAKSGRPQLEEALQRVRALRGRARCASPRRVDSADLIEEVEFTGELMRFALERCLLALEPDGGGAERADALRRELGGLLARFGDRWLRRYRAGNLWRTVERMSRIHPGVPDPARSEEDT